MTVPIIYPCPACDTPLTVIDKAPGALYTCETCGGDCEVICVDPLELIPLDESK